MKINAPKPTHGGARPGAGRKPLGRRQLTVRIKAEILDRLGDGAAAKVRELVESNFKTL